MIQNKQSRCASAGNRTRNDCLEGNHANHYTTDASYNTMMEMSTTYFKLTKMHSLGNDSHYPVNVLKWPDPIHWNCSSMLLPYTQWSLPFGALIQDWEKLASIRVLVLVEFNFANSLREHCLPCGLVVRIRRSHHRGRGSIPRTGMSYWHNDVTTFQWMQWKRKIANFLSLQSWHSYVCHFCASPTKYHTTDTLQYFK